MTKVFSLKEDPNDESRFLKQNHRPPAESEVLHGSQQRCNKQSSLFIPFVRL
ncbi:hypothetical protein H7K06_11645 [Priestia aryabhattai]|uniref:hypothetical protein n=1 Tax=Priestia aryabhattai TaxID=412384 RepID=UPI001480A35F|nr:hypothetical protein [Priestia aryabhattai]MBX9968169.1 hypothetical protein [Priestia aryabhattai]MBZ6486211.1 hypothetical protein [Priestia aryabhattai]MDH3113198.1 hypothetical protein [Priestia aryabhattai]MDH3127897.1 hypothetical protein [Priestia aryabhattai]MDH3131865.1 hypothetical protein [Priestia aryabhattai]